MYGDQCGEFLDWYLGLKGYITDTKSSNLYFFRAFIIQSSFFCLTSIPSNKKHWKTEANPKIWRNGSKVRSIYFQQMWYCYITFTSAKFSLSQFLKFNITFIKIWKNKKQTNKPKINVWKPLKYISKCLQNLFQPYYFDFMRWWVVAVFFFLCSLSPEEREEFKRQMRREAAIRNAK